MDNGAMTSRLWQSYVRTATHLHRQLIYTDSLFERTGAAPQQPRSDDELPASHRRPQPNAVIQAIHHGDPAPAPRSPQAVRSHVELSSEYSSN